jgi:cell division protein FtsI/penicillin-binding protein 2
LEKYYNDLLSSRNTKVVNFFSAVFAELNEERVSKPMMGHNLVTTLEPNVMIYLHQLLQDIQTTWQPDTVGAIIMNPKTGEVIAMDGLPSFDPNDYRKSEAKSFINPNVQGVYELGSIFKPLTMSLGIENKLITT